MFPGYLIALACIVFICSNADAQKDFRPGYVVTNGDTLKGFVLYGGRKTSDIAIFKSTKRDKARSYTTAEASAYGFKGDKQYVAIDIGVPAAPRKIFALALQKGVIDLYYSSGKFMLFKDNKLTVLERKLDSVGVKKKYGEKQPAFVKDMRFIQKLNMLIESDCGLNANSTQFSRRAISELIGKYNKCHNNYVVISNPKPVVTVGASLSMGMYRSKLVITESPGYDLTAKAGQIFQFDVEVKVPRLTDRVTIAIGFSPASLTYRGMKSTPSSSQTRIDDLTMNVYYTKIPISAKYNFGSPGNSFYVRAGGWVSKLDKEKSTFTSVRTFVSGNDSQTSDNNLEPFFPFRDPGGTFIGVGYDKSVVGRLRVFGELRYEKNGGFIGLDAAPSSKFDFMNVMIGVGF